MNLFPLFISLIPMVCWGTLDFLSGLLSRNKNPLLGLFAFHIISVLLSVPFIPIFGLNFSIMPQFFLVSLLPLMTWIFYMKAAKNTDISIVGPIGRMDFIVSSMLGIILLGEKVSLFKIAGIVCVFIGGILISINWKKFKRLNVKSFHSGALWAFLSAMCVGLLLFFMAPMSRSVGWFSSSFFVRSIVSLYILILLIARKEYGNFKVTEISWNIAAGIAIVDVIALAVYNMAVIKFEVSYVSVVVSCASVVTVMLSNIFLKEKLLMMQKLGFIFVFSGIILLQML